MLVRRLKVTSKKSVSIRFASMVIETFSALNMTIISFLNLSYLGPLALLTTAKPSCRYNPTFRLRSRTGNLSILVYKPISSHISAPTKLFIVISNIGLSVYHWNRIKRVFMECLNMLTSSLLMVVWWQK